MSRVSRLIRIQKNHHGYSKSQLDDQLFVDSLENAISTVESPDCEKVIFKSGVYDQEWEETGFTGGLTGCKDSRIQSRCSPSRTTTVRNTPSCLKSPKNLSEIVDEQEKIIELQENYIIHLKNKVKDLESEKKILSETDVVESLKTETFKIGKKIIGIKDAYKRDLKIAKQKLKANEEFIKELRSEFNTKLKEKDEKIEKLERKLEVLKENSREIQMKIQELKEEFYKERREKKKLLSENTEITCQLQRKLEENRDLIQNYQEIQVQFHNLEKKHSSLRTLNAKTTNTQYHLTNLISQFEIINQQNQILNEKLKFLSEKTVLIESENTDLKSALLRADQRVTSLKLKLKGSSLLIPNQSQTQRIINLRTSTDSIESPKLSYETGVNEFEDSSSQNKKSKIEIELNKIKRINNQLMDKEKELSEKLKLTEKSKSFYLEQSLELQKRINKMHE